MRLTVEGASPILALRLLAVRFFLPFPRIILKRHTEA
jgi:hypothetical protein